MTPTRRVAAFCLALLTIATLSACSEDAAPEAGPDEGASHGSSHGSGDDHDGGTTQSPQEGWNDADAEFLEGMIPHHQQALEMAELARTRAESREVRALAERIAAAQAPEILVMGDWLTDHGLEVPDHAHGDMHGMLSDDQMDVLAASEGAAFDSLFLMGMVQHHEGAVAMALTVLSDGEDQRVNELANDVNATQSAEIARMQSLLAGL